ncbi:caltractin [Ziziphus jujuba]|uniref:Caltractin n=1 Tax=Ziziphus jujuba TaxID=326968 RepID=A0ABM3IPJ6_ZIZJJ|nr:caltractin [Ziziphus jujuba]
MEEIHETAKAYYNNLTEDQKDGANKMFQSMDLNGDGSVSLSEYLEILGKKGYKSCNNPNFFMELDRNGDGNLDFEEFLSLYYLIKSERLLFCDGHGCGAFLKGLYFTCARCFQREMNSFDLCSSCFNGKKFRHNHATFLDNFALLRCMATGYRVRAF